MPDLLTPEMKLANARALVRAGATYFSAAVNSLVPVKVPGLGTFGVNYRGVMYYDPEIVARWTPPEIAGVMVHEVNHILRRHNLRREAAGVPDGGPLRKLWAVAVDLEINDDLKGWELPEGGMHPDKFGFPTGKMAEWYYRKLREKMAQQPDEDQGCPQCGQGGDQGSDDGDQPGEDGGQGGDGGQQSQGDDDGDGQGSGEGQGQGSGEGQGQGCPRCGGQGQGQGQGGLTGIANGNCGSAAGGTDPAGLSDLIDAVTGGRDIGRSEAEMARMRKATAEAVKAAAKNGRGTIPGDLLRWANLELEPAKVRWSTKLSRAVRRATAFHSGLVDYTYRKPSRRQIALGGWGAGTPVLPSMHAPKPKVAFVVDTSGSMGTDEGRKALSEASALLRNTTAQVEFCACDARVHTLEPVRSIKDILPLIKGGGGTDFRPAFEAVLKRRPNIIVFATDGCGPAPDEAPVGVDVIWLLIGPYRQTPATWGEAIDIEEEAA